MGDYFVKISMKELTYIICSPFVIFIEYSIEVITHIIEPIFTKIFN